MITFLPHLITAESGTKESCTVTGTQQPCYLAFRPCQAKRDDEPGRQRGGGREQCQLAGQNAPSHLSLCGPCQNHYAVRGRQGERACFPPVCSDRRIPLCGRFPGFESSLLCRVRNSLRQLQQGSWTPRRLSVQNRCEHGHPTVHLHVTPNKHQIPQHRLSPSARDIHRCLGSFGTSAPFKRSFHSFPHALLLFALTNILHARFPTGLFSN